MWLFGYGSLMWDGWETRYGCRQRMPTDLPGFTRIFNKKSLERWGTHARPGLTLNLHAGDACRGVAFEFDDGASSDITTYLNDRETCAATELRSLNSAWQNPSGIGSKPLSASCCE